MKKKQAVTMGFFQKTGRAIDDLQLGKKGEQIKKVSGQALDAFIYTLVFVKALFLIASHWIRSFKDVLFNENPLTRAIRNKDIKLIEILVEVFNYDVNGADKRYYSLLPLEYALLEADSATVDKLLAYGADPKLAAMDKRKKWSSICKAIIHGEDLALEMLNYVRDDLCLPFDQIDKEKKWELLNQACEYERFKVLELLLKNGIDINRANTATGLTQLHISCANGADKMISLLIKRGADVKARDNDGKTPLLRYRFRGDSEAAKRLIAAGADVNARDKSGWTPLHKFCSCRCQEMVQLLIDSGADVNLADKEGRTPLYYAIRNGVTTFSMFCGVPDPEQIVSLLIKHGADINARDKEGSTALHYAALQNLAGVVEILLKAGADPMIMDKQGRTPLAMAYISKASALLLLPKEYYRPPKKREEKDLMKQPPKPDKKQPPKSVRKKASPKPAAKKQVAKPGKAGAQKSNADKRRIFLKKNKTTFVCNACQGSFYDSGENVLVCKGCGRTIKLRKNIAEGVTL